jgi:hypothetical protein
VHGVKPLKVNDRNDRQLNLFANQEYGSGRYVAKERQATRGLERGDFQILILQADTGLKIIAKNLRNL